MSLAAEEKYRGFEEIMESLPARLKQIPPIAWVIVGDGDERLRPAAPAGTLGVGDRVVLTGFIPEGLSYFSY